MLFHHNDYAIYTNTILVPSFTHSATRPFFNYTICFYSSIEQWPIARRTCHHHAVHLIWHMIVLLLSAHSSVHYRSCPLTHLLTSSPTATLLYSLSTTLLLSALRTLNLLYWREHISICAVTGMHSVIIKLKTRHSWWSVYIVCYKKKKQNDIHMTHIYRGRRKRSEFRR